MRKVFSHLLRTGTLLRKGFASSGPKQGQEFLTILILCSCLRELGNKVTKTVEPLKMVQMIVTVKKIKCLEKNHIKLETTRQLEKNFLPAATQ